MFMPEVLISGRRRELTPQMKKKLCDEAGLRTGDRPDEERRQAGILCG